MARAAELSLTGTISPTCQTWCRCWRASIPTARRISTTSRAAGGVPVLVRELLKGGLLHEDVHTVAGFGLSRYTLEPWLNNGELDWREGATAPIGRPGHRDL